MECACYFDFGQPRQGSARANAYLRIIESIIRKDCDSICNASTMVAFGDSNSNPVFGICDATLSTTAIGSLKLVKKAILAVAVIHQVNHESTTMVR